MEIFKYILILLSCAVVFIVICRRLHLPAIIGYLSVGILVGPGGLGWLPSLEGIHTLAEFGIVFLMFTLGLEFSIPRLIATKRTLLGVGGLQVGICTAVGTVVAWWFGLNWIQSFVIGGGLALSSTAVVIKQVSEQKEQHSAYGSLSVNILLFQDLAAVMFLILVPALSGDASNQQLQMTFIMTIAKGLIACIGMALIGVWVLRPLFHEVAKAHSTELFMMATLLVSLSAAGITHYLDLSFALGAFLAGLMLGETEFRHQIELDIRPFRDVLLGLFFIVIGAYLELEHLPEMWPTVLALLSALILVKTIVIMIIAKAFTSISLSGALQTGIILAHGGEFSFVILSEAIDKNLLSAEQRPALFAAIVLSVMLAPLMIRFNKAIAKFLIRGRKGEVQTEDYSSHKLSDHAAELQHHVIICGFGRVGQILARFLDQENIPWLALDMDPMRLSKASIAGEKSFYGDATYTSTLSAAGLSRARMVVITFSSEVSALQVLKHVRAMRLDLPVFVRTKDDSNLESFQEAGATEVVPESLEGSIMLASHLLLTLGVPTAKILTKMRRIHTDRYETLRGMYKGNDDLSALEDQTESRRSLHSIYIQDNSFAINQPIAYLLTEDCKFSIKALTRNNNRFKNPNLDMILQVGDVIVVFATPEEVAIIEEKIITG